MLGFPPLLRWQPLPSSKCLVLLQLVELCRPAQIVCDCWLLPLGVSVAAEPCAQRRLVKQQVFFSRHDRLPLLEEQILPSLEPPSPGLWSLSLLEPPLPGLLSLSWLSMLLLQQ